MANSVRTPRQGVTANSRRIAQAVDDEGWQKFRLSLKGIPTKDKLRELRLYYIDTNVIDGVDHIGVDTADCDICIRVDNYLKSLARGGQLYAGVSLQKALDCDWILDVRK